MAHADVISLKYTIQSLLRSVVGNEVSYSDVPSLKRHMWSDAGNEVAAVSKLYIILHEVVESLQEVLEIVHNPREGEEELKGKTWDFVEPLMLKRFPLEYSVVRFTSRVDVPSLTKFLVHTKVVSSGGRIGEAASSLLALLQSLVSKQPDLRTFAGELDRAKLEINSFQEAVNTINHEQKMKDANKSLSHEFPQTMELLLGIQYYGNNVVKKVVSSGGRIGEAASSLVALLQSLVSKQPDLQTFAGELDRAKLEINSFQEAVNTTNHHQKMKDANKSLDHGMDLLQKSLSHEFPQTMELLLGIQEYGNNVVKNLEAGIRRLDMSRSNTSREILNALEVKISETMHEFEDLLETRVLSDLLNPQTEEMINLEEIASLNRYGIDDESIMSSLKSLQPDGLQKIILLFIESVNKLKQEYTTELIDPLPKEDDDNDDVVTPKIYFHKNKSAVFGLQEEVVEIKYGLNTIYNYEKIGIVTLHGMGGIGKTTLAKEVFADQSVSGCFELSAWVDVGRNYRIEKIMQSIVAQVGSNTHTTEGEGERLTLEERLRGCLVGRRFLIVLDDVWDESVHNDIKRLFPEDMNRSRVLLTTRLYNVVNPTLYKFELRFLGEEDSWDLLCAKVFSHVPSSCPPLLVNAGKKIAKSCEGLPLAIVTVGDLLSKAEKTPEHWDRVAANPNSLLEEAYDQMLKVLLPSYNCLPQHIKACFLYMGTFPQNHQIPRSEIIKLWTAERLFDKKVDHPKVVYTTITLIQNSILMPGICSSSRGRKNWSLHSSIWHLCRKVSLKNKFFHIIRSYNDGILECIKGQRRLCVHKNILFGVEEVNKSMSSISTARSLLCTGPPHQYPVPMCWGLSLLRVMNALTIRLYEFPMEVVKLVRLKYLALTCHGNLPPSISKLGKIQFLIVRRHLSIVASPSYHHLPNEIWDMRELKHLQIMGSNLPDPCDGGSLPNLETLLDVGAHSCTSGILQGLPKLNKLGIRIELSPNDRDAQPLPCLDHISHLHNLKAFRCVVVNPSFGSHDMVPPPLPIFPPSLERLSLSGLGYPWEDMRLISSLPNLVVLKLRCHAFRGPKWEIQDNGFPKLDFILIQDSELVHWTAGPKSMPKIFRMFLNSCYKLENFPKFDDCCPLIGLLNCNPLALTSAQQSHRYIQFGAQLFSSYDDCLLHPKYKRTEIDELSKLSFNFFP